MEVVSGQYVMEYPLARVIQETSDSIEAVGKRSAEQLGRVVKIRGVNRNAPTISGTRIPVASVKRLSEDGYSVAQIQAEYPDLTEADIQAALNYQERTSAA